MVKHSIISCLSLADYTLLTSGILIALLAESWLGHEIGIFPKWRYISRLLLIFWNEMDKSVSIHIRKKKIPFKATCLNTSK